MFAAFFVVVLIGSSQTSEALSMKPNDDNGSSPLSQLSRRQLLTWPIGIGGAVIYGKLLANAAEKLSRGDSAYPEAHERRVESIISKSLVAALPPKSEESETRPLRVLEVGIGKDWRVERRGLYHTALDELSARGLSKMELTGMDIEIPKSNVIEDAERRMKKLTSESQMEVGLHVIEGSITSKMDFPDGWFDTVICSLTLCSVDNQDAALEEMKRLVRPNGGTFGYVEHVAANADESYRLLNFQQELLDPLQQIVADNCHLHRSTDDNIARTFDIQEGESVVSSRLFHERFLVDSMWPVSCQCCGVIQRTG
jgi:ubiquinone/menaquinone biosynthesis C-methylase UbiE